MTKVCPLIVFLFLSTSLFAQTLNIDKLERTAVGQATKDVRFSTLLEGTVSDPNLDVFVFVYEASLKGWRAFPATTDFKAETPGRYRWRAIVQFGQLNGKGVGESHEVRAMVFDKRTVLKGLNEKAVASAVKTESIVLKRTK